MIKLFNHLLDNVKSINSKEVFKKLVITLLKTCFYDVTEFLECNLTQATNYFNFTTFVYPIYCYLDVSLSLGGFQYRVKSSPENSSLIE